jgi:hypothetical protein
MPDQPPDRAPASPPEAGPDHLAWAGGPSGRWARPADRGVDRLLSGTAPLVAAALLAVVVALLRLQSCLASGFEGRSATARMCASDLATTVSGAELGRGLAAYLSGELRLEEPPLTGLIMAALGGSTAAPQVLPAQRAFVLAWAVLAFLALVLMARGLRAVGADPWPLLLSPVLVLTVLLGPDLLGVTLATLGLVAWLRRAPLAAGSLLGAAVWARTYPVVLLVLVVALALRERDADPTRRGELRRLGLGVLGATAAVALPFVGHPTIFGQAWRPWWSAPTGTGSLWHLPALAGAPLPPWLASALAVAGWLAAAGLVALAVTTRPAGRALLAPLALLAVTVVVATGRSVPLQASLWLVPLVALAGLRWRDHLVWAGAEGVHFVAHWLFLSGLGDPAKGFPAGWYAVATIVRLAGLAWLALRAWERAVAPGACPGISAYAAPPGSLGRLPSACG